MAGVLVGAGTVATCRGRHAHISEHSLLGPLRMGAVSAENGLRLGSAFVLKSSSHCGEECLGMVTRQGTAFSLVARKARA